MAATGYLLTAFLIWAVLTALGAVQDEQPSAPTRPRRGRASRVPSRRLRARQLERPLAGALNVASLPSE